MSISAHHKVKLIENSFENFLIVIVAKWTGSTFSLKPLNTIHKVTDCHRVKLKLKMSNFSCSSFYEHKKLLPRYIFLLGGTILHQITFHREQKKLKNLLSDKNLSKYWPAAAVRNKTHMVRKLLLFGFSWLHSFQNKTRKTGDHLGAGLSRRHANRPICHPFRPGLVVSHKRSWPCVRSDLFNQP